MRVPVVNGIGKVGAIIGVTQAPCLGSRGRSRTQGSQSLFLAGRKGGVAVKRLALVAICLASLSGTALAQDAKTVIANAQKALGDVKSITYSGSAKDVAFQQCGANSTDMICKGTHNTMRPINH